MYIDHNVNYLLFLSDFNRQTSTFSTDFSENIQIANFMKIRLVGAESFNADGQSDRQMDRRDEANSCFLPI